MVSVPLQRYRLILKFRPRQALSSRRVHKSWDKNMNKDQVEGALLVANKVKTNGV